jgi:hypothetical protein
MFRQSSKPHELLSVGIARFDRDLNIDIEFFMLRAFEGGVARAHVVSRIESWVAGLEAAVANFFDFY